MFLVCYLYNIYFDIFYKTNFLKNTFLLLLIFAKKYGLRNEKLYGILKDLKIISNIFLLKHKTTIVL